MLCPHANENPFYCDCIDCECREGHCKDKLSILLCPVCGRSAGYNGYCGPSGCYNSPG